MSKLRILKLPAIGFLFLALSLPSYAGVQSITVETNVLNNGVKLGKKVIVTCNNRFGSRELLKRDDEGQWCDTHFTDVCSPKKAVTARNVCSKEYQQKLVLNRQAETEVKESLDNAELIALRKELMEIEQKRLDIANKVLDLKRQAIELQKNIASR